MPNTISTYPRVEKILANILDKDLRQRLLDGVESLKITYFPPGAEPLKGTRGAYRLRVGKYRIVYMYSPGEICIVDIDHRRQVYRK